MPEYSHITAVVMFMWQEAERGMSGEVKILDRAGLKDLNCWIEDGKATVELSLDRPAVVEAGFGRVFFRQGRGWQAGYRHLSVLFKKAAGAGHLSVQVPLHGMAGVVKNFYGVICASAVKIDRPRRMDVWFMLLMSAGLPSISISKPVMVAERAPVQAILSSDNGVLRYSLNAYGDGFRRAGLELVREINTGLSATHGLERVTATEKLVEAHPGETVQSEWRPVSRLSNPLLVATGSYPSRGDVVAVLRELGAPLKNIPLLGPWLDGPHFVAGDGAPVIYRLKLRVDRKSVDEAEIKVSSSKPPNA